MALQVGVVSREIIKPSSPTPIHLRPYLFSSIDQTATPKMYSYVILFFESSGKTKPNITEITKVLKKSLAQVLTLYYPLAGRAHADERSIDCNDEGAPYLEAQVNNWTLSDFLRNPIIDGLPKLVPFELDDGDNDIPFGVQLNVFRCGDFAIGQCFTHKISDGTSILMFGKAWAGITRRALGDHRAKIIRPELVSATPCLHPSCFHRHQALVSQRIYKVVTKAFVFDAANIELLRAKYVGRQHPTRVETLTAFIWSRLVECTKEDAIRDQQKLHKVSHVVNMRLRFEPPLALKYFGNMITIVDATPSLSNTKEECYGLARQLREAIRKINMCYIKKLQENGEDKCTSSGNDTVTSIFTSLCNYPLYNDFGWGRPSWAPIGMPALDFNNTIIFTDTRDGKGIEVSITSTGEVLTKLQRDNEFLKRTCSTWLSSGL